MRKIDEILKKKFGLTVIPYEGSLPVHWKEDSEAGKIVPRLWQEFIIKGQLIDKEVSYYLEKYPDHLLLNRLNLETVLFDYIKATKEFAEKFNRPFFADLAIAFHKIYGFEDKKKVITEFIVKNPKELRISLRGKTLFREEAVLAFAIHGFYLLVFKENYKEARQLLEYCLDLGYGNHKAPYALGIEIWEKEKEIAERNNKQSDELDQFRYKRLVNDRVTDYLSEIMADDEIDFESGFYFEFDDEAEEDSTESKPDYDFDYAYALVKHRFGLNLSPFPGSRSIDYDHMGKGALIASFWRRFMSGKSFDEETLIDLRIEFPDSPALTYLYHQIHLETYFTQTDSNPLGEDMQNLLPGSRYSILHEVLSEAHFPVKSKSKFNKALDGKRTPKEFFENRPVYYPELILFLVLDGMANFTEGNLEKGYTRFCDLIYLLYDPELLTPLLVTNMVLYGKSFLEDKFSIPAPSDPEWLIDLMQKDKRFCTEDEIDLLAKIHFATIVQTYFDEEISLYESDDTGDAMESSHTATVRRLEPRTGRNDPCPCGSGKKYKKCCGKN